jgi:hypothetical protein
VIKTPQDPRGKKPWEPDLAFEVWKQLAGAGGGDKDRMLQIDPWLLGFSAAIIAYAFKKPLENGYAFVSPLSVLMLSAIGVGLSALVVVVAQMYGGYANRNWAAADAIARDYGWSYLNPGESVVERDLNEKMHKAGSFARAMRSSACTRRRRGRRRASCSEMSGVGRFR